MDGALSIQLRRRFALSHVGRFEALDLGAKGVLQTLRARDPKAEAEIPWVGQTCRIRLGLTAPMRWVASWPDGALESLAAVSQDDSPPHEREE